MPAEVIVMTQDLARTANRRNWSEDYFKRIDSYGSPRKPFNELKMNLTDDGPDDTCSKDDTDDANREESTKRWQEIEDDLSERDKEQVVPAVDCLIYSITEDFLTDGRLGGLSLLNSMVSASSVRSSRRDPLRPAAASSRQQAWTGSGCRQRSEDGTMSSRVGRDGQSKDEQGGGRSKQAPQGHQRLSLAKMMAEKSSLKRELRALDVEFEEREGRKPTKAEKEHLRPLYVRYWKLKHQIGKMQSIGSQVQVH
mmetsp:Transcript_1945/g.4593  ORF Transcript_1945/g.4593 Transcript_1945/m.4593 type:complete len:253 (-) Transcript_1945:53-811(-)